MMKVYCFDTETTGLIANRTIKIEEQPSVIEFYGTLVDLKTGKLGKGYGTLIKPPETKQVLDSFNPDKMKNGKTIEHMTGISLEMLKDAPTMKQVYKRIKKELEGAPACGAHNLSFDREMMDIEAERLEDEIKWPRIMICSVEQTTHMLGHRLNLTKLHELLFNEKFEGAHRAKADVEAQARVMIELFRRGML